MASKLLSSPAVAFALALALSEEVLGSPCLPSSSSTSRAEPSEWIETPYQSLPEATRRDLQWALIWTGHYTGEVDGIVGPRTIGAIRDFQSRLGGFPSATLSQTEAEALFRLASAREASFGFQVIHDEDTGLPIRLPITFAPFAMQTDRGSAYRSRDRQTEIQTLRFQDGRTLCELYRRITGLSGRVVTYTLARQNSFVVMGRDGGRAFFMQAFDGEGEDGAPEIRAISISYPESKRLHLHPMVVAIWNTFRPFGETTLPFDPEWHPETGGIPKPLLPAELYRLVSPSVYRVVARRPGELPGAFETAGGSAVAVSNEHALTNCHVVKDATQIEIWSESVFYVAKLSSADDQNDRCILEVSGQLTPLSGFRKYHDLAVGDPVFTIGSPYGLENTFASGMVSGKRSLKGLRYVQTTAPIFPGSSGGALVDIYGSLVGITTWYLRDGQNMSFAIAVEEFCQDLKERCQPRQFESTDDDSGLGISPASPPF